MALTKATYSMILGGAANVLDYGADPTGVADSAAAITAAIATLNQQNANFSQVVDGVTINYAAGSVGQLYFPKGTYKVSTTITIPSYCRVIGDHSTITADGSFNIFNVSGFETHIEGLSFLKGSVGINYTQGNVDTAINSVTNCQFEGQSSYSITSLNTASTKLNIDNCKFLSAGGVLYTECDECTFESSWIKAYKTNIAHIKNHGSLSCRDLICVPDIPSDPLTTFWVQNGNSSTKEGNWTYLERVHFGGENGGMGIAVNYAQAAGANEVYRGIIFESCSIWGTNAIVFLSEIPDFLIAKNSHFSVGSNPRLVYLDVLPSLTYSPLIDIDFPALGKYIEIVPPQSTNGASADNLLATNSYFTGSAAAGNLGTGGASISTAALDVFGVLKQDTFGSDNGSQLYRTYSYSALSIVNGWYTASVVVKATKDVTVTIGVTGAGGVKQYHVPGDSKYHLIAHQFFNPGANTDITFALYNVRTDGVVVTWGDPKLVSGYVQNPSVSYNGSTSTPEVFNFNGTYYSSTAPTAGSEWNKGAIIYNMNPTSGGYIGWVCTVTGTPGTWKGFGTIA